MKHEIDEVGVGHYTNEELGIYDFMCSPKMRFFDKPLRVILNWKSNWHDGQPGWWIGEMGITVVVQNKYPIGGEELVKWDNGELSAVHRSRLNMIE